MDSYPSTDLSGVVYTKHHRSIAENFMETMKLNDTNRSPIMLKNGLIGVNGPHQQPCFIPLKGSVQNVLRQTSSIAFPSYG